MTNTRTLNDLKQAWSRRDLLKLLGAGGVVFASGLPGCGSSPGAKSTPGESSGEDFFFLQLSDTHWGYSGDANPESDQTLRQVVATINSVDMQPDFIVFTGDLTHTTDDPQLRRDRMSQFRDIVGQLKTKTLRFLPGEHDASLDAGAAYQELFGDLHYSFDHKGVHFAVLDNVSDPTGSVGAPQIAWLAKDLGALRPGAPIVILTHRPLFDLYPAWDWATRDGSSVVEVLSRHENVTVFYGHIHQEHHFTTGNIKHHAARSLIFPLPAPGSMPTKTPLPWDPAHPNQGLGYRTITKVGLSYELDEHPVKS